MLTLANASDLNNDDGFNVSSVTKIVRVTMKGNKKKKRKVSKEPEVDPVKLFWELKLKFYKMGIFHGELSGCLMFEIAHLFKKNTDELLWLEAFASSVSQASTVLGGEFGPTK